MRSPPAWLNALTYLHAKLTAILAAMALQLWLPTNTYGAGGRDGEVAGNWRVIAHYLDEKSLGTVLWSVACIGLVSILARQRWMRLGGIVVLALAHGIMAAFFLWSNPAGIGSILLLGYAVDGAFLAFRRTSEAS